MHFELPPLPYSPSALEPHIRARTVEIHYEKHHRGYMEKLREQIEGKPEENLSLEEIIRSADGDLFNHAAQVWNHTFYWRSMKPGGGGDPPPDLARRLTETFGSVDGFKRRFAEAALAEFGSGWAWLVTGPDQKLRVRSSSDADNPLQQGQTPLLTLDVWEHAYYLDYQNERGRYVEGFLDHLLDWDFVASNLSTAQSSSSWG